jgi:hypothetical protein
MKPKEEKFVERYLTHGNAVQAAREAGYSEASSYKAPSRLLTRPEIMVKIREHQERAQERTGWNMERLIRTVEDAISLARTCDKPGDMIRGAEFLGKICNITPPEKLAVQSQVMGDLSHNVVVHVPKFAEYCSKISVEATADDATSN